VALVAVLASTGAAGIGTPSKLAWPAAGAGSRWPSELIEVVFTLDELFEPPEGDEPPLTARVMPTATAATTTTAPAPISRRWRRLRRASAARISAILALAFDWFLLPLDMAPSFHLLPTYVDSNMG
jgi:hypothetical protein